MTGLALDACDECLRRAWLLAALSPCLDRGRARLAEVLALADDELIAALGGKLAAELRYAHAGFRARAARAECHRRDVSAICRHSPSYPARLSRLPDPPAVIHVLGDVGAATALEGDPGIAIVGARRASSYGVEVSRGLGRSLAASGATVLSGMALGVDSAAHAGALEAGGRSVAILGGGCDVPYPVAKRRLHGELAAGGALVSELPPGTHPRPWTFVARNRLIAALARTVVVVEATRHSGSLITARFARELGVDVAAVPGHITSALAQGTNDLLADGAQVVRDAQDVLDCAYGFGARQAPGPREQADPRLRPLFEQIAAGCDTVDALTASGADVRTVTTALAELELAGLVRRLPGGRYSVVA